MGVLQAEERRGGSVLCARGGRLGKGGGGVVDDAGQEIDIRYDVRHRSVSPLLSSGLL